MNLARSERPRRGRIRAGPRNGLCTSSGRTLLPAERTHGRHPSLVYDGGSCAEPLPRPPPLGGRRAADDRGGAPFGGAPSRRSPLARLGPFAGLGVGEIAAFVRG